MKNILFCIAVFVAPITLLQASEVPEVLEKCFTKDKPIKAQEVAIVPPREYEQFIQRLSEAASKDSEWFNEHTEKTPEGSPFPLYDEKLGMTKEEYDNYVKLWDSREAKKLSDVVLILKEVGDAEWQINGSGVAAPLSLLRYNPEKNVFISPNGELESIADIDALPTSLLGAWEGKEWRYQTVNSLTTLRENLAFGTAKDGKYSFLIYRLQEIRTKSGKPLADKRLIIRFAAKNAK